MTGHGRRRRRRAGIAGAVRRVLAAWAAAWAVAWAAAWAGGVTAAAGEAASARDLGGRQIELCMVGDSITWWGEGDNFRACLLELMPELAFVGTHSASLGYSHAGEGGDNTRQVLERIGDRERVPDSRYYHVLIGVNDNAAARSEADVPTVAARTRGRIERIVKALAARPGTEKVFLGSLLPCCPDNDPASEAMRFRDAANSEVNRLFREGWDEIFPDGKVVWVEYEEPLRARDDWRKIIRLHPRCAGYAVLAGLLAPRLRQHAEAGRNPIAPKDAGVAVENRWREADGLTAPLIPGAYAISFDAPADGATKARLISAGEPAPKTAFNREVTLTPSGDGRVQGLFELPQPAFGARLAVEGATPPRRILVEKMRPSRRASVYGTGVYVDTASPISPGELVVDAKSFSRAACAGEAENGKDGKDGKEKASSASGANGPVKAAAPAAAEKSTEIEKGDGMKTSIRHAAMAATIAVATAAGAASGEAAPENLLKNADFSAKTNDWRPWGAARKLTPEDRAAFLTYVMDETLGRRVLQIRESFDVRVYVVQRLELAGAPEKGYTLRLRAKADKGARFCAGVMYNKQDEAGKEKFLTSDSAILTGTGEWTEYTVACRRTPADASRFYVFLDATDGKAASTGAAWFADASLTPGANHDSVTGGD